MKRFEYSALRFTDLLFWNVRKNTFEYPVVPWLTLILRSNRELARENVSESEKLESRFERNIDFFLVGGQNEFNGCFIDLAIFILAEISRAVSSQFSRDWEWSICWSKRGRGSLCLGLAYHWPIDATHVAFLKLQISCVRQESIKTLKFSLVRHNIVGEKLRFVVNAVEMIKYNKNF